MIFFRLINILKLLNYIKNTISYIFSYISNKVIIYGNPSFASFELSSICNLHCTQCDVGRGLTDRKNKFLNFDDYCNIIDKIGNTLIDAIFYFQGEPLLNKNFCKYISYAKRYNIYAITSTNAQIINKKFAEDIILSGLDKIIISIDGITEDTYQKYRKGGTLKKTIESINILKETKKELNSKSPVIEAQFIVFSFNEHQINDFKNLYKEWGADKYSIKTAQICNPNENYELIPHNKKYSRYKKIDGNWKIKKKYKNACIRIWTGLVVSSDENILPCCFDKQEKYIYGNLNSNKNILSIWKGNKANNFRSRILKNRSSIDICRNCNE